MTQEKDIAQQIQEIYHLKAIHFADLIRASQLIFDPTGGVSGIARCVDWQEFGIPEAVIENLQELGKEYRYASPHVPIDIIWGKLTAETRTWFMENKDDLWVFEEIFPALDED